MTHGHYWSEAEVFDALQEAVSSSMPGKKFVAYLKDFQSDNLTTGTMDRPPSFFSQALAIRTVIYQRLHNQGLHQIIKKTDAPYNLPVSYFFTTLAVMHYVLHEIEVTYNIGHTLIEVDPIEPSQEVSYAEIIVSDELAQKLTVPPPTKVTHDSTRAQGEYITAEIRMPKNIVYIQLSTGEKYHVKKLTSDRAPHSFMNYVINRDGTDIPRGIIQTKVDGCATKKDMTELVKQCGFTKELYPFKDIFFAGTTKAKVHFIKTVTLTSEQIELLKRVAKQIA